MIPSCRLFWGILLLQNLELIISNLNDIKEVYPTLYLDCIDDVVAKNPRLLWKNSHWNNDLILYLPNYLKNDTTSKPQFSHEFLKEFDHSFEAVRGFSFSVKFDQRKNSTGTLLFLDKKTQARRYRIWITARTSEKGTIDINVFIINPFTRETRITFRGSNIKVPVYSRNDDPIMPIWNNLIVTLNRRKFSVFLNCKLIHEKNISKKQNQQTALDIFKKLYRLSPDSYNSNSIQGSLGMRSNNERIYSGYMKDAVFVFTKDLYNTECNDVPLKSRLVGLKSDIADPFTVNENERIENLQMSVNILMKKIKDLEARISQRESCQCLPQCSYSSNGFRYILGSKWQIDPCEKCECTAMGTHCERQSCPKLSCDNPIKLHNQCCSICPKDCMLNGQTFSHGKTIKKGCTECICQNGNLDCRRDDPVKSCPEVNCTASERYIPQGECCEKCRENTFDFCKRLTNPCHEKATCHSKFNSFECKCETGYLGDGKRATLKNPLGSSTTDSKVRGCIPICQPKCLNGGRCDRPGICKCGPGYSGKNCEFDINECQILENVCPRNSHCVNTLGSFMCQCDPGFRAENQSKCKKINFCNGERGKDFTCPKGYECVNKEDSYSCHSVTNSSAINMDCLVITDDGESLVVANDEIVPNPWRSDEESCNYCHCKNGVIECQSLWQTKGTSSNLCPRLKRQEVQLNDTCSNLCVEDENVERNPDCFLDVGDMTVKIREQAEMFLINSDNTKSCKCSGSHLRCKKFKREDQSMLSIPMDISIRKDLNEDCWIYGDNETLTVSSGENVKCNFKSLFLNGKIVQILFNTTNSNI